MREVELPPTLAKGEAVDGVGDVVDVQADDEVAAAATRGAVYGEAHVGEVPSTPPWRRPRGGRAVWEAALLRRDDEGARRGGWVGDALAGGVAGVAG